MTNETTTGESGECQFCGRVQKLRNGRLVQHGYLRPGCGRIIGKCLGAGKRPYAVTCGDLKAYLPSALESLSNLTEHQAKMAARTSLVLCVVSPLGRAYDVYASVTHSYVWERHEDNAISRARVATGQMQLTVDVWAKRIGDWRAAA